MAYKNPNAPIIARLFATNTPPNERIEIDSYRTEGPNTGSQIRFYRNGEPQFQAAKLYLITEGLDPSIESVMMLSGSDYAGDGLPASIYLTEFADGTNEVAFQGDKLWLNNGIAQGPIQAWDAIAADVEQWKNVPLAGTWGDLPGARAGYYMDVTGRVQLRGVVVGGAGPGIGTLPAGYRPTQSMEWIMRGQGGVVLCAVTVSTAGVLTATANPGTAQASGVRLDSISFPTH